MSASLTKFKTSVIVHNDNFAILKKSKSLRVSNPEITKLLTTAFATSETVTLGCQE